MNKPKQTLSMRKTLFAAITLMLALTACDDNTDTLGSSLTNTEDLIHVTDDIFDIASKTVTVDSVISRNTLGYLGLVKDPETGAYVKSDFITQFHISEGYAFPPKDTLAKGINADSCDVRLFLQDFYGDSLASMKATLYELRKPIEEDAVFYNNFDPVAQGFVRIGTATAQCTKAYSLVNKNLSDSLRHSSNYTNNILFNLNQPYISADGKEYNNYGTYIMDRYYANPEDFKNSYTFSHNVCPGFYIKLENGIGSMAYIRSSQMNVYYTIHDSIDKPSYNSFAGTEEVRQVTRIITDNNRINQLAQDNTCTYVKSPAGLFTELTLPVEEICKDHENDSIISAQVVLKCFNKDAELKYAFKAPETLLMVQNAKMKEFFEESKIADYRTSFIASLASDGSSYTFGNIGHLIRTMYDAMPADANAREEWKRNNPDWNKVLLIPVKADYTTLQTSSILSSVTHDMSLTSAKLVGGSDSRNGGITISVIYSKFNKE